VAVGEIKSDVRETRYLSDEGTQVLSRWEVQQS
jgi:hypothetical protein